MDELITIIEDSDRNTKYQMYLNQYPELIFFITSIDLHLIRTMLKTNVYMYIRLNSNDNNIALLIEGGYIPTIYLVKYSSEEESPPIYINLVNEVLFELINKFRIIYEEKGWL